MVQTEKMKDGGMEVVRCGNVLDGFESELVGAAIGCARLHACSRQPTGKAVRVVVAALSAHLKHRHAPELGSEND